MDQFRLRVFVLITSIACIVSASPQRSLAVDEFIWRDRWDRMGRLFQIGYMVGIADELQVLSEWYARLDTLSKGTALLRSLRRAHICTAQFHTVREAVDFATTAMNKQSDPLIPAARVIYDTLNSEPCDSIVKDFGKNYLSVGKSFLWKDRWDEELRHPDLPEGSNLYIDGYVAGIIDLVRHLDNSGKTEPVLAKDVTSAAQCEEKIGNGKNISIGQLTRVILKSVGGPNHSDPTESMPEAVFEALRICRL